MALFSTKPQPVKPKYLFNHIRFIQPNDFSKDELEIAQLIQRRRLQLLIHSRLYYELNTNLVADSEFDRFAYELVALQKKYPEISSRVVFAEAFEDWDGSTGAFLPLNDPWVVYKTKRLLGGSQDEKSKSIKVSSPKKKKTTKNSHSSPRKGLF